MSISDTGWCFFMLGGIRAVFAPVGTHQPGLCYNDIDMFPRTRRSVPGADRTDGKPVDQFLEPIARTENPSISS